jgi:cytochrome c oxidase subunit III
MAGFTTTVSLDEPMTLGDGGVPPSAPFGADGAPDWDLPGYETRLRRARLGLVVAVTPIVMLFVSFTSAYIVRQGLPTLDPATNTLVHDWFPVQLPKLLLANTLVLLLSSVTMELARRQLTREFSLVGMLGVPVRKDREEVSVGRGRKIPWLALTLGLGFAFLTGQWMAWRQLGAAGFHLDTTPSSSFVYLLTGMHALHLLGGLVALLVASVAYVLRRPVGSRRIVVDVTAWYWHFMALLWVYILCLLEFAR